MLEIRDTGFTRIPIYASKEDNIIGILYAKDLIGLFDETKTIGDLLKHRKPIPVKDTIPLDNLMNHFIKEKVHIATVYDSFGTFTSIAALEDVIEEIIRVEIIDELDETPDMQHLAAELIQPNFLKE